MRMCPPCNCIFFLIHCSQSSVKYSNDHEVGKIKRMHVAYRLITSYFFNPIQFTVEPHPLQSMGSCSLTPTQQKAQWWCSSVTQGLCQREWWQQCVGGMVSGPPTQEVSPVAPPLHPHPHPHPHRHSQRHSYSPQVLHLISLDLVRVNFCYYAFHFIRSSANLYESVYITTKPIRINIMPITSTTACHHFPAGSSNEGSNISALCSTSIAITAVVSCAVSFTLGALVGAVVHYCTVRKKSNCQKCYSLTMVRKQQQQQPAPVYEDVVGQSQNIELKENVAYSPVQQ